MSGAVTATGLRDAGCTVVVHAAVGGRGGHRGRGISWSSGPPVQSDEFLDSVTAMVARERPDVIYPLTEPIQWRIEDEAPAWSALVWPRPGDAARAVRRDKRRVSALVAAAGVAIPDERDVHAESSDAELAALGMPVVVKGIRGRGGNATRIAGSCDEARLAVRALAGRVPTFLQRYIPGATYLTGGVFADGAPIRWYSGMKRVQFPIRTGPAAMIESVHDDALDDAARRAFAALETNGLASADFIRDLDGCYYFLELNPRPWGSLSAAADAGVDMFPPLAALLAGSAPRTSLACRTGVSSAVLPLCLLSAICWRTGIAPRAILRAFRSSASRDPGELMHLASRVVRVGIGWRR